LWAFPIPSARAFTSADSDTESEPASGIVRGTSGIYTTDGVLDSFYKNFHSEDSTARRVSSLPIERTFIYLDVSDFSKYRPGQEALIINSLVRLVNDSKHLAMVVSPFSPRPSLRGRGEDL